MSFWSSETLKRRLDEVITPGKEERVQQGAYELALGPEAYLSGEREKRRLDPLQMIQIAPGQVAVLLTEETVSIPEDHIAFISLKSTPKLPGLINVSGFHVDPGFSGRLMFTVFNAGAEPRAFCRGEPLFLIWFASMDNGGDPYRGKNQNLGSIPSRIINQLPHKPASAAEVGERLDRLTGRVAWGLGIGGTVLAILLANTLLRGFWSDQPQPVQVITGARTPIGAHESERTEDDVVGQPVPRGGD